MSSVPKLFILNTILVGEILVLLAGVPRDCHHEEAGPPQRCQACRGS